MYSSATGGNSNIEQGRNPKKRLICPNASSSDIATLSIDPFVVWISEPPRDSFERSSNVACFTMGGPAAKNCDGNLIVSGELGTLVRS